MMDELNLCFLNKKKLNRPIYFTIRRPADMYNLKKRLIQFYDKRVHHTITGFRLVTKEPANDYEDDTIKDNYFDEKYDNFDAFIIMKKIKELNYYQSEKNKLLQIYFRAIKLRINVSVVSQKSTQEFSFPLAYEGNSFENLILNIENAINFKVIDQPYHVFQNTENLDIVSNEVDMKKYQKNGLVIFIFPMRARFINKDTEENTSVLLKFNKPLKDYLDQSIRQKLKITTSNISVKIKNNAIDINLPVHQILKQQTTEPVLFEIYNIYPNKISILIPLKKKSSIDNIQFDFEYTPEDLKIDDFIEMIKKYFDTNDLKVKLLDTDNKEVRINVKVNKYKKQALTLKFDQSINLKMKRIFEIKNKKFTKTYIIDQTIKYIINEIAKENRINNSLVTLMLGGIVMNPNMYIGNYFIPTNEVITVKIKDFTSFVTLKIIGNDYSKSQIKFGIIPEMKIKSLRQSIPTNLQSEITFFLDGEKLDEKLTFKFYQIKGGEVIEAHTERCFIFTYDGDDFTIFGAKDYTDITTQLQEHFFLRPDHFFIDINGKLLTNKTRINDFPNGTTFELKRSYNITFKIDEKYEICARSTEQVKDLVADFIKKSKIEDRIQLEKDDGKVLNRDLYLFSIFEPKGPSYVYKLHSKEAMNITFQYSNGKFFNEILLSSMKMCDVLEELKAKKKNVTNNTVIIFMGRIADPDLTLSDLLSILRKDDYNEYLDIEPFILEDETPAQIEIELKFKIDASKKSSNRNLNGLFSFIKGCEVLHVHYFAAMICQQEYDSITLESNGELLNDEDIIEEDTQIVVDLPSLTRDKKKNAQKTKDIFNDTMKNINLFKSQKTIEDSDYNEYDEEYEEEEDIFVRGNGTFRQSDDNPENEYVFKFKVIGGEDFELQLPKNITVSDVKDKIAEKEGTDLENITIFVGNHRLADFNILTNLTIPKKVSYFSVKIIDLRNTLICTRIKPK